MNHSTSCGTAADFIKQRIGERLRKLTGSTSSIDAFAHPLGDAGLFGPDSQVWRVHAHFAAMMVGGLSSLMVQALHPRALAAVWDHSDFRSKLKDRLGATAYFVAATTYGSEEMALAAIRRVNRIHANVRGVDLQGQPYVANDPLLLRWVHLVEVTSFLKAYQLLASQPLSQAQADQYIAEMTRIGHMLGAVDLPNTCRDTEDAIEAFRDQLVYSERTQLSMRTVRAYPADLWDQPYIQLILRCANHLLPSWAVALMGENSACDLDIQLTKTALQLASAPIQWTLDQEGVAAVARRRVMTRSETTYASATL